MVRTNGDAPQQREAPVVLPMLSHDTQPNHPPGGQRVIRKKAPMKRDEDWEPLRQRIQDLYRAQSKTISQVKDILAADHQFHATERQLKFQINKWNLDKKIKHHEMSFIASKIRDWKRVQSVDPGRRDLKFTVRGERVPMAKVRRWRNRTVLGDDADRARAEMARGERAPTPEGVWYGTASERASSPSDSINADSVSENIPVRMKSASTDTPTSIFQEVVETPAVEQVPQGSIMPPASIQPNEMHFPQVPPANDLGKMIQGLPLTNNPLFPYYGADSRLALAVGNHFAREHFPDFQSPQFLDLEEQRLRQRMRALEIAYGILHPSTVDSMSQLARHLVLQGQILDATMIYSRLITISQGPEPVSSGTIRSLHCLRMVLTCAGVPVNNVEYQELHRREREIIDTATDAVASYARQGRLGEARELDDELKRLREACRGPSSY